MDDTQRIDYVPSFLCPLQDGGRQGEHDCRALDWSLDGVALPDPNSGVERTFGVQRCSRCAMAFTDPVPSPETSALLYEDRDSNNFQSDDPPMVGTVKRLAAQRDLGKMLELAGVPHMTSMLDYGCGNGTFAVIAAEHHQGARVVATDYHDEEPEAIAASKADISYRSYAELEAEPSTYDLVLCRHVLEHTYDPAETLRQLGGLVSEDGAILVEVPRFDSPLRHLFGRFWNGYYVPYHPLHFTLEGMANVAARAGLDLVADGPAEMPSMGRSLQNVLRRPYSLPLFLAGVALHPIQLLVGRISGRSLAMRVVLRRRPS